MSSPPSAHEIARDARWLAQALEPSSGLVRLVEMTPDAYRFASFLDDRMLAGLLNALTRPWNEVAGAIPPDARSDARWIFHVGHVGSTLVSRLLGELDGVLAVREPRILRDVAATERREEFLPPVRKLMSRTFAADQIALVKATSFVSEIAAELVPPGGHSLFLYSDPRTYIATILAGENNLQELEALAGDRARRMATRVRGFPMGTSAAHLAAAAWACEMTALEAAAEAMTGQRVLWATFDELLADMDAGLARLAAFFGFEAPVERIREIARGPLMSRYSKGLDYEYSPKLRRELIDQEIGLQGAQIEDALAVIGKAAGQSPLLARAMARA